MELSYMRNWIEENIMLSLHLIHSNSSIQHANSQNRRVQDASGNRSEVYTIVEDSFREINNKLNVFNQRAKRFKKNPFEILPLELLEYIFCFIPTARELAHLREVCKCWKESIDGNHQLWKPYCMEWWNNSALEVFNKRFSLDEIINYCHMRFGKSWKWLAMCLASYEKQNGLSWVIYEDEGRCVDIGEMKNGEINGIGIYLGPKDGGEWIVGECKDDLVHGAAIQNWICGDKYEGQWKHNRMHGYGVYYWADGGKYEGEWREGAMCGTATITWANGYSYTGEFRDNAPVDVMACIHPDLKAAIKEKLCTGVVTGASSKYGQMLYNCHTDAKLYCEVCKETCHSHDPNSGEEVWSSHWFRAAHCDCVHSDTCASSTFSPRSKKLKTQR